MTGCPAVQERDLKTGSSYHRRYYFWFFGYVAKLPYEHQVTAEAAEDFLGLRLSPSG